MNYFALVSEKFPSIAEEIFSITRSFHPSTSKASFILYFIHIESFHQTFPSFNISVKALPITKRFHLRNPFNHLAIWKIVHHLTERNIVSSSITQPFISVKWYLDQDYPSFFINYWQPLTTTQISPPLIPKIPIDDEVKVILIRIPLHWNEELSN